MRFETMTTAELIKAAEAMDESTPRETLAAIAIELISRIPEDKNIFY